MDEPWLVDIPVLILFFNRPEPLQQVFNAVKEAKPSVLFLYQDGARKGNAQDLKNVLKCREVVEEIDWNCEVHRLYQEKNYGCDPSEYLSQKWAFSFVDKCVILEDDDLPSVSFFVFCKELLEKYENDERISMIAGMNHEEITNDIQEDYFFTSNVSIWGWATWKRVVDKWDSTYSFMSNKDGIKRIKSAMKKYNYRKDFWPMLKEHSKSGIEYYESILMSYMLLNNGLSIVPKKNMITNVGYNNGTHSSKDFDELPDFLKKIYSLKRYDVSVPLVHPENVVENKEYKRRVYEMMKWDHYYYRRFISFVLKCKRKIFG